MDIQKRLEEHYEYVKKLYPEDQIVGIFLHGSQNYGLDTENSDIDSKAIIIPSYKYYYLENKEYPNKTIKLDNGEEISINTVQSFISSLKKQNPNFIEVLFTEYKIINPKYETEWEMLVRRREKIARYDEKRCIKAMLSMAISQEKRIFRKTDKNAKRFENRGYDPKRFYQLKRFSELIDRYINDEPFSECLKSKQADLLKQIKNNCEYTQGDVVWMSSVELDRLKRKVNEELMTSKIINTDLDLIFENFLECIALKLLYTEQNCYFEIHDWFKI